MLKIWFRSEQYKRLTNQPKNIKTNEKSIFSNFRMIVGNGLRPEIWDKFKARSVHFLHQQY